MGNERNSSKLFTNHQELYPVELDDVQIAKSGTQPSNSSDNNASNGSNIPSKTMTGLGSIHFGAASGLDPHAWMSNADKANNPFSKLIMYSLTSIVVIPPGS